MLHRPEIPASHLINDPRACEKALVVLPCCSQERCGKLGSEVPVHST